VTVSRSVVPGEWYAVLGDEVVVLLPPAAKARVAGVWERVDEGAGFDEVLDALISGGLRELRGFVLVSDTGGDVKLVIRGAGEARLTTADGPVTISGDAGSTWVERHVPGVTGLRLSVAEDDGDGDAYTLGSGLVRVSSVVQPAAEAAADTGPLVTASAPDPEPYVGDPLTDEIPAQLMEPAAPASGPAAYVPPVPPVVPPAEPEVPASPPGAHTAEPAVAPPPVARLVFSNGEVVDVDRTIVVGRAPRLPGDGHDETRLVTVPSPHQEISSTHLEIRPGAGADHGSAVVTDLGSTNGTLVVQPGLPAEDLQPGIAVQLLPGAMVDLGEGVTIQVATV
jgi:hypothetical protein